MTTLLVQELKTELVQEFTLGLSDRYNIGSFIPYLYVHNAPAGTFTFTITKDSVDIFSQTFTSSDIKAAEGTVNNYLHVFYPIVPDTNVFMECGDFSAKLTASGYAYSSSSFLGWIQQHEDLNNILDYVPATDAENPLAMRIKIYKEGLLCA